LEKPVITPFKQFLDITPKCYEDYSPTAFDDTLDFLEKVNKIIKRLNELGEITSDLMNKWNEVMEWVMNDGLTQAVIDRLNEWLADGTLANIINVTIFNDLNTRIGTLEKSLSFVNVKKYGVVGDGVTDDTAKINLALASEKNLFFPSGTYKTTSRIDLTSNTHIIMSNNAILKRYHDDVVISNWDTTSTGYNGQSNITIEGGIIDCNASQFPDVANGISFAHGSDLVVRDLTILNTPQGHALEITGNKNVLVDNVRFRGYRIDDANADYYVEAIQIEPCLPPPIGADYTFVYKTDFTVTKNVTVRNCTFEASSAYPAHPCGVGAHGVKYDLFYDNIKVINNTFDGQSYWAIRPFKFRHSVITGNVIRNNTGGGIYVVTPNGGQSIMDVNGVTQVPQAIDNIIVSDNVLSDVAGKGIHVIGDSTAFLTRILVDNNVLKNIGGVGIQVEYVANSIVRGNSLYNVTGRGFYLNLIKDMTFKDNMVDKVTENGFFISGASTRFRIQDNHISNLDFYGLNISGTCFDFSIKQNRITNFSQVTNGAYDGILVSDGATNVKVIGNILRTESGKNRPRYGLNCQPNTSNVQRYGNDFSCNAVTTNLKDDSTAPITSVSDIS
jgi:hypothetical protein